MTPTTPCLTPVGYLIVENSDQVCLVGTNIRYYGVDRMPYFIAPETENRKNAGEALIEDARLYNALDEWFDLNDGRSKFLKDLAHARALRDSLQLSGIPLDLIFCEIADKSPEEITTQSGLIVGDDRPSFSTTYGFDVSWPNCRHSAIRQPDVIPGNRLWEARLNQWGLLSNFDDATSLRQEYLKVYPYPPFDIFQVKKVDLEQPNR